MATPEPDIIIMPLDAEEVHALFAELDADLLKRYPKQWIHGLHPEDTAHPECVCVVLRIGEMLAGCGVLRRWDGRTAEIKRMFVRPAYRRQGFSRRILISLESVARSRGYARLLLETGTEQPESLGLYRSSGYREVPCYGEYIGDPFSRCFEKDLV